MRFDDILNKNLPSENPYDLPDDGDDYFSPKANEACKKEGCRREDGEDYDLDDIPDDIEDDLDDIDIDDIEDEDITEDDLSAIDDDDEVDVDLDDDEEVEADKIMSLAATPILLDKELTDDETVESVIDEFPTLVNEGFMFESDLNMIVDNSTNSLFEERAFAPKTKVQFSEKDRRKQLFEVGVQASARAANDPKYWKLQKVYKMERQLKADLRQKYRGEALKRVKTYIRRLKASKSKIMNNLANKLTGK